MTLALTLTRTHMHTHTHTYTQVYGTGYGTVRLSTSAGVNKLVVSFKLGTLSISLNAITIPDNTDNFDVGFSYSAGAGTPGPGYKLLL